MKDIIDGARLEAWVVIDKLPDVPLDKLYVGWFHSCWHRGEVNAIDSCVRIKSAEIACVVSGSTTDVHDTDWIVEGSMDNVVVHQLVKALVLIIESRLLDRTMKTLLLVV